MRSGWNKEKEGEEVPEGLSAWAIMFLGMFLIGIIVAVLAFAGALSF